MKTDEALSAEQAVEQRLADVGADRIRSPQGPQGSDPQTTEAPAEEAAPPAETPAEPVAETEPPAAEPQGDPAAAAVLAKYGNDPEKVAAAYAQLQRKLGEQGTELGAHREQSAEYARIEAEMADLRQQVSQPQQTYVDAATVDWFDQAVLENPQGAMEWARQQGNGPLFQRGISTWKDSDPFGASQYVTDLRLQEMQAQMQQQRPSDESVGIQSGLNQVLSEHPEFVQYAGDLEGVIGRYPSVAAGLRGGEQDKKQAIETLFRLAEGETLRSLALNGHTPESASSAEVATPTVGEAHSDSTPAPPDKLSEFRAQFRQEADRLKGERAVPQASQHYVAR